MISGETRVNGNVRYPGDVTVDDIGVRVAKVKREPLPGEGKSEIPVCVTRVGGPFADQWPTSPNMNQPMSQGPIVGRIYFAVPTTQVAGSPELRIEGDHYTQPPTESCLFIS
jgi:hypothetical protein